VTKKRYKNFDERRKWRKKVEKRLKISTQNVKKDNNIVTKHQPQLFETTDNLVNALLFDSIMQLLRSAAVFSTIYLTMQTNEERY